MERFVLTDAQWAKMEPHCLGKPTDPVPEVIGLAVGVVLFTKGLLATLVADTAPEELRGTAFGMFNLITGLALLVASVSAGALWDVVGPQGTFLGGCLHRSEF
jgi:MFS family permease